ncbi:hypothetical protein H257_00608 [Aphanomyces astaci]|uniref:Nudix hydrolase domain-containing protein n=1 Tax=Aphanomyces astaci TaxID=112090 RepID=W4HD80_APHAT|nr:hypothetical protein H257_00608 [Aphanomyces astaci]ETV89264.1 hypothetical protein H257_00608 [Aphanomyces astaci]|eukprot:XP_009821664.1 hypothetical protein H257_00608 [Aphanomyces astaci]
MNQRNFAINNMQASLEQKLNSLTAREQVEIVDLDNNVVGKADRSVMRVFSLPHRATYIVIRNSAGDFYVQRRTLIKDYCPGFLDPMAGGVVQAGESYEDNALREVKEEMGVSGVPLTFVCTFFYQDASTVVWGGMFECVYDGALTLQPEEVSQVLVMSASDIIARADEFTPDGLFAMRLYLEESTKATAAHPHA